MPVLLRVRPYRFFIVLFDCRERRHVHVRGGGPGEAKVWLDEEVSVAAARGYTPREVERVIRVARIHREKLVERWMEACKDASQ